MMGVLPWSIWGKSEGTDDRRRRMLALNLLLIEVQDRLILIDSGLGNRLSPKQEEIYRPSGHLIPKSLAGLGFKQEDITDVILTHLHFDHAGGLVSTDGERDCLSFPNAAHWVQNTEWAMAKNPDELNQAAYAFEHQLALVQDQAKLELIDGRMEIAPGVTLHKVGGHSVGSQIVEINAPDGFYIYPSDIVPTLFHARIAVTSAYDISRQDTVSAKKYIFATLKEHGGTLFLNHDTQSWEITDF